MVYSTSSSSGEVERNLLLEMMAARNKQNVSETESSGQKKKVLLGKSANYLSKIFSVNELFFKNSI
jgi:hypothetical protein